MRKITSEPMKYPLITITICTFNGERYIAQTIDSVLIQTYPNIEIIIVDDGSNDTTIQIINKYMKNDSRIRFFARKNAGLPASRNFAFSQARGDWVAIIDQDDLCFPQRLMKQFEITKKFPSAELIFCNTDYINEIGQKIGDHLLSFSLPNSFIRKNLAGNLLLIKGCYVDSEACFIKRSLIDSIGFLDESLKYACDYEYFIRAGLQSDFAYTSETLSSWRIHPNQESVRNKNRFKEYRSVLIKYIFHTEVKLLTRFIILFNFLRSILGQSYRSARNLLFN